MKEILSLSVGTQKMLMDDGNVRYFNYQIIASRGADNSMQYGIKISDDSGGSISAPGISCDFEKIRQFAYNLYKLSVTPLSLGDVADDFLAN